MGLGREVLARRLLAVAAWVLATLAAGTVAWGAVSRLGNEGAVNAGDPLSAAQVREALQRQPARTAPSSSVAPTGSRSPRSTDSTTSAAAGAAARPDGDSPPSSGTADRSGEVSTSRSSAPARETRSWQLVGGTVGAACRDTTIDLLYAVPRDGWSQSVEQNGPTRLVVAFTRGGASSQLVAACVDGSPATQLGTGYVQGTSGSSPTDSADRAEPETGD